MFWNEFSLVVGSGAWPPQIWEDKRTDLSRVPLFYFHLEWCSGQEYDWGLKRLSKPRQGRARIWLCDDIHNTRKIWIFDAQFLFCSASQMFHGTHTHPKKICVFIYICISIYIYAYCLCVFLFTWNSNFGGNLDFYFLDLVTLDWKV